MAQNTISFPTVSTPSISSLRSDATQPDQSSVVALPRHAAVLEICELVYGASPSSWDTLERFYDTNAIYENPFLTASSRAVISDIHCVSSHLATLDVPRPVAVLCTLLGMKDASWKDPWFHALKVWSEIGDVCESESFDGHRKTIVEHTLHIMLLPGLHRSDRQPSARGTPHTSTDGRSLSFPVSSIQHAAANSTLGMDLSLPSPLHFRLPVISRLYFNDAGKITHHRDFWDVKDLIGLIPGMPIAQWISGRLVAQGVRSAAWFARSFFRSQPPQPDAESRVAGAEAFAKSVRETQARRNFTLDHRSL